MSDDKTTLREALIGVFGSKHATKATATKEETIGDLQPVRNAYIEADDIGWLVQQLQSRPGIDTEAHVDRVELTTTHGVLVFEVEDDHLTIALEGEEE